MAKVAVVTGANKGIGFEVARGLGKAGFMVLLGARDAGRGEEAAAKLRAEALDVRFVHADLGTHTRVELRLQNISQKSLAVLTYW